MRLTIWKQRSLGLRARLALGYAGVLVLALMALGLVAGALLNRALRDVAVEDLVEDSTQLRRHFRVGPSGVYWEYNPEVNEEAFFVRRLRRMLLVADNTGTPIEVSPEYTRLGVETPDALKRIFTGKLPAVRTRITGDGGEFLMRSEIVTFADKNYWVTTGTETDENRLARTLTTSYYLIVLPICVLLAVIGWLLAERALKPLNDVARAAQQISGANLRKLIPMRGADDELDHLIASFNEMTQRLETSFSQIKHFSTDVSHELRTPLTTIRGQLEVAMLTSASDAQLREAMLGCVAEVEHLSKLVSALLQLASVESGQMVMNREKVDLGKLVSDVAARYGELADLQNVACHVYANEAIVAGDKTQLDRMVTNLVTNAIKYTPAGGKVTVRVASTGHEAVLKVEDTGRGIPAQHVPHIFDRFYRVSGGPDPERGLGLGLSFVAWIVKAHGGRIEVMSEVGRGSTFLVTLPAYREHMA